MEKERSSNDANEDKSNPGSTFEEERVASERDEENHDDEITQAIDPDTVVVGSGTAVIVRCAPLFCLRLASMVHSSVRLVSKGFVDIYIVLQGFRYLGYNAYPSIFEAEADRRRGRCRGSRGKSSDVEVLDVVADVILAVVVPEGGSSSKSRGKAQVTRESEGDERRHEGNVEPLGDERGAGEQNDSSESLTGSRGAAGLVSAQEKLRLDRFMAKHELSKVGVVLMAVRSEYTFKDIPKEGFLAFRGQIRLGMQLPLRRLVKKVLNFWEVTPCQMNGNFYEMIKVVEGMNVELCREKRGLIEWFDIVSFYSGKANKKIDTYHIQCHVDKLWLFDLCSTGRGWDKNLVVVQGQQRKGEKKVLQEGSKKWKKRFPTPEGPPVKGVMHTKRMDMDPAGGGVGEGIKVFVSEDITAGAIVDGVADALGPNLTIKGAGGVAVEEPVG
ncbi:hypothetical protein GIB67_022135 [Kingdonia uniflora]|uniref:Uncharacterized protein n=1 Tax=Kingdonia uniflora TaxID=39325 RepID=A0A7J7N981_9MAGN|nr:hypothetical protein GIB67_022135 [Kingdonia uniflora]